MNLYRICAEDDFHEIICDKIKVEDDELLIFINDELSGVFKEWDFYYQLLRKPGEEEEEGIPTDTEDMKKFFQGFSYKDPATAEKRSKMIKAFTELYNAC